MIKKMFLIIAMLVGYYPFNVKAVDYTEYISVNSYRIDSYNVDITVNDNNVLEITETIRAYFTDPKHGIIRKIPFRNNVNRLDGSKNYTFAKIDNIKVNEEYKTKKEEEYQIIQIGNAKETIEGEKEYVISYNYNLGKDKSKKYDELYFNIIGTEWDTIIDNATFTIKMPKSFDSSKLGFSNGPKGSTNNDVKYSVDGNVIAGSLNKRLNSYEGITIRLELPEGYFANAKDNTSPYQILAFVIPISFFLISLYLWLRYGKNDIVETVEFYPPEGFNSAELGFLYKGKAEAKDIVSLLVYLANKGYIKIEEKEEKVMFSKNLSYTIEKVKDYDGDNVIESKFLEGLFKKKNKVNERDLYNKFYRTLNNILNLINAKENKEKILEKTKPLKITMIIFIFVTIYTIFLMPALEYPSAMAILSSLIIVSFYMPFYAMGLFAEFPKLVRFFWIGFTIFHSLFFFSTLPIKTAILANPFYLLSTIIGIFSVLGIYICLKNMDKRTKYGAEILGKIRGFKRFLEIAEKDKLENMVSSNPKYFYDILPFAYVLGVSDKWISKFETIALESPDWYKNSNGFRMNTFGPFINTTLTSAKTAMASSYSSTSSSSSSSSGSSSSSSSSGGGSSGGGSGGGGGSSW